MKNHSPQLLIDKLLKDNKPVYGEDFFRNRVDGERTEKDGYAAETYLVEGERECHNHFGTTLAKAGFTVVMPEIIGFGQCRQEEDVVQANSCQTLALELLPLGYTLTGLRLWQALTVLDLVEEHYGTFRLGCFGFSGGGLLGYLLTALDERITALGLSGYCFTFEDSIYEHCHCPDNYIPGIFRLCDQPEIARLIAPRPLFVEAGREDSVFPFRGARKAMERIRRAYDDGGASQNFTEFPWEGGHEIFGLTMI